MVRRKRCPFCQALFRPDPRVARHPRVCSAEPCQERRRQETNRRYWATYAPLRRKDRVLARASEAPPRVPRELDPVLSELQDVIPPNVFAESIVTLDQAMHALQDVMRRQVLILQGEFRLFAERAWQDATDGRAPAS